jgi:NADP-dependent 3-hydroxy acid dehydrogenase YdfG
MSVVLVTGATTGIGAAVADRLANEGHWVFAGVRDPARLTLPTGPRPTGGSLCPVVVDVDDDAAVEAAVSKIDNFAGGVEILVSNAGVGYNATTEDIDTARMAAVLNTNVLGAVRCAKSCLPGMRARGSGHVVIISSMLGRATVPGQVPYVASKWALEAVAESLRRPEPPTCI